MLHSNIAVTVFQINIQLQAFSCSIQHISACMITIFMSNHRRDLQKICYILLCTVIILYCIALLLLYYIVK